MLIFFLSLRVSDAYVKPLSIIVSFSLNFSFLVILLLLKTFVA